MDIGYVIENSGGIVLILFVLYFIYKTFSPIFSKMFATKEDLNKIGLDINHVSQKADNYCTNSKSELLTISSNLTEKMRLIQQETMEKADYKFLSKEMDAQKTRQQEERFNKLEAEVQYMRTTLEDVKTTGEVNASKLDNILELLSQN